MMIILKQFVKRKKERKTQTRALQNRNEITKEGKNKGIKEEITK